MMALIVLGGAVVLLVVGIVLHIAAAVGRFRQRRAP